MDAPRSLVDWPWVAVRVDCKLCTRRGCYRLARLAHRYGPDIALERLLHDLAQDCPWNRTNPRKYEPRCGIRLTDWDMDRPAPDLPTRPSDGSGNPNQIVRISDHPGPQVVITCAPCRRRGVYDARRLIARHGDVPLPTLLNIIAAGCPGLKERTPRCQAVFERLRR